MLHFSPIWNGPEAMTSHHTAVFDIDHEGRIVSMFEDAAQILSACPDVIRVEDDNRLSLSEPERQCPSPEPIRIAGTQQHNLLKIYSKSAGSQLTIHILQRTDFGASVVVFTPALNTRPDAPRLTGREREVLLLAAKGLRRDRMAHALGLSIATIDLHCAKLRRKLGAKTTSQAVAKALTDFGI